MNLFKLLWLKAAFIPLAIVLLAAVPTPSWAAVDLLVLGLSTPAGYVRPATPPGSTDNWPNPNASFYIDWAYVNSGSTYFSLHDGFANWNAGGNVGPATTNQSQFGPKITAMMTVAKKIVFLCAGVAYQKGQAAPMLGLNGNPGFGQYTNYELSVIAFNSPIRKKVQWLAGTELSKNVEANAFCQ